MPYISQLRRRELDVSVSSPIQTPGELNYAITQLINHYLKTHKLSYDTIADILSGLEGAKLEFYRRIAEPYENDKMQLNGDVY